MEEEQVRATAKVSLVVQTRSEVNSLDSQRGKAELFAVNTRVKRVVRSNL